MKKIVSVFVLLFVVANLAHATTREDVLICGLPDGSEFILRSKYDWSLIPLPLRHASRESNRRDWEIHYKDRSGHASHVPGVINYVSKFKPTLDFVCARFGMKNGVPLAPFTFRRTDGSWHRLSRSQQELLDVDMRNALPETRLQMESMGLPHAEFHLALLTQDHGMLVFEKPLHRSDGGFLYSRPIDAVLQSLSRDDGKTWSSLSVELNPKIFDIGKGWVEQTHRAHLLSLNGKSVPD